MKSLPMPRPRRSEIADNGQWAQATLTSDSRLVELRAARVSFNGMSSGLVIDAGKSSHGFDRDRNETRMPVGFFSQVLQWSYAKSEAFDPLWYASGDRRYASAQRSEQNQGPVGVVLRYAS